MAVLNTKNFSTLVQNQAAAMQGRESANAAFQGRAPVLLDFSVGSFNRALVEAVAGVALWLQALIIRVLSVTRAATSNGFDLDTWVGDWGLERLGASFAVGTVTFSRLTPSAQAVILIGATIKTADGTQSFAVVADPSNTAYNAGLSGYVLPAGQASINVPVQAISSGAVGNVIASSIALISSSLPFVDSVTNAAAIAGGSDAESDSALRDRFRAFIASLSKATVGAVAYAVDSFQLGLAHTIQENEDYSGAWLPGHFVVVFDDGSGAPTDLLLSQVYERIDETRAAGVTFELHKPVVVPCSVSCLLTVQQGYDRNVVVGAVFTALTGSLNAWPLGQPVPYSKLAQLAYEASAGVTNVSSLLLNGGTADLAITYRQLVRAGTITVS